jgi:adenylosuccinate lyase
MDPFGDKGIQLLEHFSKRLGLKAPLSAWHVARDRSAEFLSTMAILGGTVARIADEIRSLARSETGELEEPFIMGKVGSSTMPHKRNPEMCEQVVVLARLIKANAGLGFEGMINEHERDYRSVRLEWVTITDTSLFICGALALTQAILKDLIVHDKQVQKHVDEAAPFICSEALMFLLGKTIGKQTAHQVLYEVSMSAVEKGRPLLDVLMEHSDIKKKFRKNDLKDAMNPANHVGLSQVITTRVTDALKEKLKDSAGDSTDERECPLSEKKGGCIL